jgi:hypothetical protein
MTQQQRQKQKQKFVTKCAEIFGRIPLALKFSFKRLLCA